MAYAYLLNMFYICRCGIRVSRFGTTETWNVFDIRQFHTQCCCQPHTAVSVHRPSTSENLKIRTDAGRESRNDTVTKFVAFVHVVCDTMCTNFVVNGPRLTRL